MTRKTETENEASEWRPYCGFVYPLSKTAGTPIICTRQVHNVTKERHYNEDSGFSWWQQSQGGSDDDDH